MVVFLMSDGPNPSQEGKLTSSSKAKAVHLGKGRRIGFEIRVSWLLLGSVLVAFGPIAALAVVASVHNADALSTVALALAIVAFAIQILVFIVQTQTASQQMLQSERLNTQTRELLVEVKTSAASTQTMVGEQFHDLLRAFLEGASTTAAETGKFDPEQFEQRLLANIQKASQTTGPEQRPVSVNQEPARKVREQRKARRREQAQLTEFPPETVGREIAAQVRKLSNDARSRLSELAEDEISSRDSGIYIGLEDNNSADGELTAHDLITQARVRVGDDTIEVKRLTPKGRKWASLLVATGDIPDYAQGLTPPPAVDSDDDAP